VAERVSGNMQRIFVAIAFALIVGCNSEVQVDSKRPVPAPVPCKPPPKCEPNKPCPRWPQGQDMSAVGGIGASVGGKVSPDGKEEIICDLPGSLHQKNTGGSDGAGLCVFASARHAGRWQGDSGFAGLFDWMRQHPGGGYPEKFTRMLQQFCSEKGLKVPEYIQIEENDLDILEAASRNGYMICTTYSRSPTGRYGGQRIAHMVNAAHFTKNWVAILDNNYIGEDNYEWMTPQEYLKAASGGRKLWAILLLVPQPPPCPRSK
jgi:hypothetical protein